MVSIKWPGTAPGTMVGTGPVQGSVLYKLVKC